MTSLLSSLLLSPLSIELLCHHTEQINHQEPCVSSSPCHLPMLLRAAALQTADTPGVQVLTLTSCTWRPGGTLTLCRARLARCPVPGFQVMTSSADLVTTNSFTQTSGRQAASPPPTPPRWAENNNNLFSSVTDSFVSPCNVNPAKSREATVKICLMVEILYDVMLGMKNYCQLWWLEGPDAQIGLIPVRCHIHQS